MAQRRGGGREGDGGLVHEVAEQVLLTNYKALELFMSECHTIRRESGVFESPVLWRESPLPTSSSHSTLQQTQNGGGGGRVSQRSRHASPGDSARGTDHESSEEEGQNLSHLFPLVQN